MRPEFNRLVYKTNKPRKHAQIIIKQKTHQTEVSVEANTVQRK